MTCKDCVIEWVPYSHTGNWLILSVANLGHVARLERYCKTSQTCNQSYGVSWDLPNKSLGPDIVITEMPGHSLW